MFASELFHSKELKELANLQKRTRRGMPSKVDAQSKRNIPARVQSKKRKEKLSLYIKFLPTAKVDLEHPASLSQEKFSPFVP